jgi:DNA polymerase eta
VLHTGKRKTALESFLAKNSDSIVPKAGPSNPVPVELLEAEEEEVIEIRGEEQGEKGESWICPKCAMAYAAPQGKEKVDAVEYVKAHRQEHEDWHFAMHLQGGGGSMNRNEVEVTVKVKKKVKKPEGIKAFFTKTPKP